MGNPKHTARTAKVRLSDIDLTNTDGTARPGELMTAWVRDLAIARRNTGRLDPVLLWRNPEAPEDPLMILDGRHRIAAYRSLKITRNIPAKVLSCPWRDALLFSGEQHSRGKMSLSGEERADFAWRLVREEGLSFSKAEIAKATGSSARTVARMRARLKQFQGEDREGTLTGNWWRDREDREDRPMEDDTTDAQRRAMTDEAIKAIRNLLDRRDGTAWKRDAGIVDEALARALGEQRIRAIAEFTFADPGESAEWFSTLVSRSPEDDPHEMIPEDF